MMYLIEGKDKNYYIKTSDDIVNFDEQLTAGDRVKFYQQNTTLKGKIIMESGIRKTSHFFD